MQALERSFEGATEAIRNLAKDELRRLEDCLRQLSRAQILFVRDTLEVARLEERIPLHHISFLEYLLQEWWEHSIETKLAVILRVVSISDSGVWPEDDEDDPVIGGLLAQAETATVPA